jgi:hypothetical protein
MTREDVKVMDAYLEVGEVVRAARTIGSVLYDDV